MNRTKKILGCTADYARCRTGTYSAVTENYYYSEHVV